MTMLMTQSKFARGLGISRSTVSRQCLGAFKDAIVGNYIDIHHFEVVIFIEKYKKKGRKINFDTRPTPEPKKKKKVVVESIEAVIGEPMTLVKSALPKNLVEYGDWTLNQIINEFGTAEAFESYFKAFKRLCDIREKVIKIDERAGLLVSRRLVELSVLDPVNTVHERLLSDGKKTIARRIHAAVKSGEDMVVLEQIVARELTAHIRPLKAKIGKALEDAK